MALAAAVRYRPEGLVGGGAVLAAAWLGSLLLNRELPPSVQRRGVLLPALFLALGGAAALGAPRELVAGAWLLAGGGLALGALARTALARGVYGVWMDAALPVGWSIARVLLAATWYGVVTPIGLTLRLVRGDALGRRWDEAATTYWVERRAPHASARYFRQY